MRRIQYAFILTGMRVVLLLSGLSGGIRMASVFAKPCRARQGDSVVREVVSGIEAAARLLPWRIRCLEQSISICAILGSKGIDARLRLGVQLLPFVAHAWVAVGERAVNESQEVVDTYRVVETFRVLEER